MQIKQELKQLQQNSNKFKVRNRFNKLRSRKAELICLIRNWPKSYTDGLDATVKFSISL